MRGYGGKYKTPGRPAGGNLGGAMFVLDSDSTLEGSGPSTVIRESSCMSTRTPGASSGENMASFVVIAGYASAYVNGSTSRNITVRNLNSSPIDVEPNARTDVIDDVSIDNNVIESTTRTWRETGGTKINHDVIVQNGAHTGGWTNVPVTGNYLERCQYGLVAEMPAAEDWPEKSVAINPAPG